MTVQDCSDLERFLEDTRYRRSWLLIRALRDETLDRALLLAQRCDDFVTGVSSNQAIDSVVQNRRAPASVQKEPPPEDAPRPAGIPDKPAVPPATRSNLALPDRERLLGRLAEGAKNAELAAEFGLSPRQVQGIRMGCARQIRSRDERCETPKETADAGKTAASINDIVRYLRQQDDIVVPQEGGKFLVNARFQLSVAELMTRANRMRERQGKPQFDLEGISQVESKSVNGHPQSWGSTAAVA